MESPRATARSTRLHSSRRGSSSLLFSNAKRTRRGTGCSTSRASENKQARESEGRSGSHWHLFTAQRTINLAQVWTRSFASLRRTSEQPAKQLEEMEDDHCKNGGWRKLLSMALARCKPRDIPLGHRAPSLERNVVRTSPVFLSFGTEPLLVNTESKTDRGRQRQTETDSQTDRKTERQKERKENKERKERKERKEKRGRKQPKKEERET